ncbi:MAG: ferredoxin--NADP reductase [Planctomycetota bacterium]
MTKWDLTPVLELKYDALGRRVQTTHASPAALLERTLSFWHRLGFPEPTNDNGPPQPPRPARAGGLTVTVTAAAPLAARPAAVPLKIDDMEETVHSPAAAHATNAVLVAREDLTDVLTIIRVRHDESVPHACGSVPDFQPGQFVRLGVPKLAEPIRLTARAGASAASLKPGPSAAVVPPAAPAQSAPSADRPSTDPTHASRAGRIRLTRRAYSIASSPLERSYMEFFVVRIDEGELTPRLWQIYPGGRLWMDPVAKGEFTLDHAPPGKDLVMISTGTGIAPFMSMLRTCRGQDRWRRFILIHGARYAADLAYRTELEQLVRADPTVCYIPIVTREPEGGEWTGMRGRVQTTLAHDIYCKHVGTPLDPAECHVFLCGNPQMIDDVAALLESRGFTTDARDHPGNIHFERYW